ncbi:MAG: ParB/RepB/Spo0J family partition protein [Defluviitaleaceae bacterium]|nr:ParB/RepB/Spo0J family partition protein [Defluviitaleaceae bacterium]
MSTPTITRATPTNTDIFTPQQLQNGACCFFSEDTKSNKKSTYFFEIRGQTAVLSTSATEKTFIQAAIQEFLLYSNFIHKICDVQGNVLMQKPPQKLQLVEISKIQPSQFYISQQKLADCQNWLVSEKAVYIPIMGRGGKLIALDGHTRLKAAANLGFAKIFVYEDFSEDYILDFVAACENRHIYSVFDMTVLNGEEYNLKWLKYCAEYFSGL